MAIKNQTLIVTAIFFVVCCPQVYKLNENFSYMMYYASFSKNWSYLEHFGNKHCYLAKSTVLTVLIKEVSIPIYFNSFETIKPK